MKGLFFVALFVGFSLIGCESETQQPAEITDTTTTVVDTTASVTVEEAPAQ